ncbi:MAG TPA: hypothetical protein VN616_02560, partial [Puia sp.]|nr:hypothetical protein [Puia sp.]
PLWHECGIQRYTCWVSEMQKNDFPALPVFQDRNLLVTISFFRNEADYAQKMKLLRSKESPAFLADFLDAVTTKSSLVLYPTTRTAQRRQ